MPDKKEESKGPIPPDFFEMGTVTDDLAPYWRRKNAKEGG